MQRCPWCLNDPLYVSYHDHKWGRVCTDDKELFACLCLESMQAGLSWLTILKRRKHLYDAFANFDPSIIATFAQHDIDRLLNNTNIIRHHGKIKAIINNAHAYLSITKQQSFVDYLSNIIGMPQMNHPKILSDIPTKTPLSMKLAKQLKSDGFIFVGATSCYAFMQATGFVNDHLISCTFK